MLYALILLAVVAWVLQLVLGMRQLRRFQHHVRTLRAAKGRVAIGKSKGRILAGTIMLLCIDEACHIVYGEVMQGFTVFARFRPFDKLNGLSLLALDEAICRAHGLDRQQAKAALSARKDYLDYEAKVQEEGKGAKQPVHTEGL